jgi:hypothetical protein
LVEETAVPGENHRPVASHWQTLSHKVVSSTQRQTWGSKSGINHVSAKNTHYWAVDSFLRELTVLQQIHLPSHSNTHITLFNLVRMIIIMILMFIHCICFLINTSNYTS